MLQGLIDFSTRLESGAASLGDPFEVKGRVRRVAGETLAVSSCPLGLGDRCRIEVGERTVEAEVIGLSGEEILVQPLASIRGVRVGALVKPIQESREPCLDDLLGRVVNGLMVPLDGGAPIAASERRQVLADRINPLSRSPITEQLDLGVRVLDALLSVGVGQRIGVFAGSGVGKSVLLGMIGRSVQADVVVVGLIGERGREVREFVEENLGVGLEQSVVVASPADDSPVMRTRAAFTATRIAERYRAEGKRVLLMMDSHTRVAQAQREIGLAAGEPPTTKGYTPSVFRLLPELVERTGNLGTDGGAITAIYTVLTEEDDLQEPVADATRAILDGHIVLDRRLAESGLYPAVDVAASISRVMPRITAESQLEAAREFRELWSRYRDQQDLITVGAYERGSDAITDKAIALLPRLRAFVAQGATQVVPRAAGVAQLLNLIPDSQLPATTGAQDG